MPRTRPVIFASLAIMIAAVAWLIWFRAPRPQPIIAPAVVTSGDVEATAADNGTAQFDRPRDTSGAVERTPATFDADPTADAPSVVRVTARWPNEVPADGVTIFVRRSEQGIAPAVLEFAVADQHGEVTFTGLPLGKASLYADRGDRLSIEIHAGPQDVRFELKAGVAVRGTVLDPGGAPVASATIWLQTSRTDWSGGHALTKSDGDGTFELSHIDPSLSLGAIAAGYTPSKLIDLDVVDTSNPPAVVELRLRPGGGRLVGVVTDATGHPIEAAIVATGASPRFLDHQGGRTVEAWSQRTARTDRRGEFAIEGLATGNVPVAIRARGYGLWRTDVEIRVQQTTTIESRLLACAALTGTVSNGAGTPLAGAVIRVYDRAPKTSFIGGGQIDFYETFGHVAAIADAAGRYWIDAVTPGTANVFAQRGGKPEQGVSVAYTATTFEIAPGETLEWNPTIADGHSLEGIVLYRDGHPMPDVFVTLTDEQSGKEVVQTNADDGVFRFLNLDAATYGVRVQYWDAPKGTPALQQSGLVPNSGRVELRAPFDRPIEQADGVVLGRVVDSAGRITNPKAATVALHSDARWYREDGKLVDGAFRFEGVTPCRFRLALQQGEQVLAQSDWFELQPAATLDTGTLHTEPQGAAKIRVDRQPGTEMCQPKLYLRRAGFGASTVVELGRGVEVVAENLTPGAYEVSGHAAGMAMLRATMIVTAGETTELTLTMRAGAVCHFSVWFPAGSAPTQRRYRILDSQGRVFREDAGEIQSLPIRPYPIVVLVPVGEWTIEFASDDHLSGRAAFTVANPTDEVSVRVDLE